jgi:hypothetical protein
MNPTHPGRRTRPARACFLALLMSLGLCGAAMAQTTFFASGIAAAPAGSGGCDSFSDTSATQAYGSAAGGPCGVAANIGSVEAIASAAGLGAAASLTHFCCSTSASSGATARVDTRLRISGPAGTVPVSLNLVLNAGGDAGAFIAIGAQQFGSGSITARLDGTVARSNLGLLIPDIDCSGCTITSQTINLSANTDHFFRLQLEARVSSGVENYTGSVDAFGGGGLGFPTAGPVFNLPAGYTASIEGMGVVDNRWISPVPEPGSRVLLALGLLGVAARLHRRRSGATRPDFIPF